MAIRNLLLLALAAAMLAGCGRGLAGKDSHPWPDGLRVSEKEHGAATECPVFVVRNTALPLCKD